MVLDLNSRSYKVLNGYCEFVEIGRMVYFLIYDIKSWEFFYFLLEFVFSKVKFERSIGFWV